jgi:hypothetical protein
MAEHVFESPLVEEFYNSCHLKSNGKFCGVGTKGKSASRVPMSDAARASNASLRAKAAKTRRKMAAKMAQSKTAMDKLSGQAAKVKTRKPEYGSGKTEPKALSLTQKYGTRNTGQRPAGVGSGSSKKVTVKATPSNIKYGADKYGSGKTNPGAAALTAKYGTRNAGTKSQKKSQKPQYGSGKTEPKALSLTQKYGTRRK